MSDIYGDQQNFVQAMDEETAEFLYSEEGVQHMLHPEGEVETVTSITFILATHPAFHVGRMN